MFIYIYFKEIFIVAWTYICVGYYVKNIKKIALGLLLLLTSGVTVGIAMSDVAQNKVYSWRYKMTVEVETPEGIKTGSAVREVEVTFKPRPGHYPSGYLAKHKMKGEAVIVDLGERGILFATITPDSYPEVTETFPGPPAFTIAGAEYYSQLEQNAQPLSPKRYPQIVMFQNISDPKSVKLVKGREFDIRKQQEIAIDNFEEIFGKNTNLKNISIETTDQSVEWKIQRWLPWIDDIDGGYLDGQFSGGGPELANILHGGNFRLGGAQ